MKPLDFKPRVPRYLLPSKAPDLDIPEIFGFLFSLLALGGILSSSYAVSFSESEEEAGGGGSLVLERLRRFLVALELLSGKKAIKIMNGHVPLLDRRS